MSNIIRRLFFQNRAFLIACAALLGFFQFLTCAIVASMNLPTMFDQFLIFAPPVIRALIEQSIPGVSAAGILAFTWNHPAIHALMTAVAITLGARAVAGEIENGVIELVLAQPVSRVNYLSAHLVFAVFSLAFVAFAGLIGMIVGQGVFDLQAFAGDRLLRFVANTLLVQMRWYALTLLFSTFGRKNGRVAILGMLVAIISFLDSLLATLWNRAAFMKPYSLHTYYDPRTILVDGSLAVSSVIVLAVFIVVATS